jgi:hypothetical protein
VNLGLKNSDRDGAIFEGIADTLEKWLKKLHNSEFIKRYRLGQFKCD